MKSIDKTITKLQNELYTVQMRLRKLSYFMNGDDFLKVSDNQQHFMKIEKKTLVQYVNILTKRINDLKENGSYGYRI